MSTRKTSTGNIQALGSNDDQNESTGNDIKAPGSNDDQNESTLCSIVSFVAIIFLIALVSVGLYKLIDYYFVSHPSCSPDKKEDDKCACGTKEGCTYCEKSTESCQDKTCKPKVDDKCACGTKEGCTYCEKSTESCQDKTCKPKPTTTTYAKLQQQRRQYSMGSSASGGASLAPSNKSTNSDYNQFVTADGYTTRSGLKSSPNNNRSSNYSPILQVGNTRTLSDGERLTVVKSDTSPAVLRNPATFWGSTRPEPNMSFGVM